MQGAVVSRMQGAVVSRVQGAVVSRMQGAVVGRIQGVGTVAECNHAEWAGSIRLSTSSTSLESRTKEENTDAVHVSLQTLVSLLHDRIHGEGAESMVQRRSPYAFDCSHQLG
jgi:hypothetical protein